MEKPPPPPRTFGDFTELEANPERTTAADLNNFHLYLPQSGYLEFFSTEILDRPNELLRGNTLRRFFNAVALALQELPPAERELIMRLDRERSEIPKSNLDARIRRTTALTEALLPLYRALRAKGYSHRVLVT